MRGLSLGTALLPALAVCALLVACSGDSDPSPAPETRTPEAGSRVTPTAVAFPPDNPTGPPPPSDRPCPIDAAVCDFAVQLLPVLRAGDTDALLALAEPLPGTCPQPGAGLGGPSFELCDGVAPGETRFGYWSCSSHCTLLSESELRAVLEHWFAVIPAATGNDSYGPGTLRVGAVSCARPPGEPRGTCGAGWQRVQFTFIVPAPPASGDLPPDQRISFHVALHVATNGRLVVDGFGIVVPPNSVLSAFSLPARGEDGRDVTLENYPWTP